MTNLQNLTIIIKQSLGPIKFGMPIEEVIKLIGNADEVETIDNTDDEPTTVMHYADLGITLFLEGINAVLVCIDIENMNSTLFGEMVFDMKEEDIVKLMIKNGYKEEDVDNEDWGERRVSFGEANIDFFFDNGELMSINIGK